MLTVTPIPAFNDNYIWALHDAGHAVLVDPGDAGPCIEFLEQNGLSLQAVLLTHHHSDHVDGVPALVERYRPRIYGSQLDTTPGITDPVSDGDQINIAELKLQFNVISTPGHTRGHIAYYDGHRLFCGDTLFACGCGRLFEGTPAEMLSSLNKLIQLPDITQVFCAHEYTLSNIRFAKTVDSMNSRLLEREQSEMTKRQAGHPTLPSTIALEKATNPFLRCHEPALIKAAQKILQRPPKDDVEVFATLRKAKDSF